MCIRDRSSAITVSYTPPAVNPLQDVAGNDAAAISSKAVSVDNTPPTIIPTTPVDKAISVPVADNIVITCLLYTSKCV